MYNLKEYSGNYAKASEMLWEYYRDKPALNNGPIIDLTANNTVTDLFKLTDKQATMAEKCVKNSTIELSN